MGVPSGGGGRLNIGEVARAAGHELELPAAPGTAAEATGVDGSGWLQAGADDSVNATERAGRVLLLPLTAQCCRSSS